MTGLRPAGNAVNISVNNQPAKSVEMVCKSAVRVDGKPLDERIRLVALTGRSSTVLYMVFIAPDPDFNDLHPIFERIMRSFVLRN